MALAILSPVFQSLKTKSPADGKDRQRHNAKRHGLQPVRFHRVCGTCGGTLTISAVIF
jgi:hypothetical protein